MTNFWLDIWQQMTRQVCECKHTKRHHIKLGKGFDSRSDIQCLDMVFEGGAYGENGLLACCQCLSYHKKRITLFWRFTLFFKKQKLISTDPQDYHCFCGHTAYEHSIGDGSPFLPIYPPCRICDCKQYDYVNNPKIG